MNTVLRRCLSLLITLLLIVTSAVSEDISSVCDSCNLEKETKLYKLTNANGSEMYMHYCDECKGNIELTVFLNGGNMEEVEQIELAEQMDDPFTLADQKSNSNGFRYEGPGFDTPEDAALCYFAGLKNLNFEQMLFSFAWETQAEHFDFRSLLERAKGIDPVYVPGMPFSCALLYSANLELLRNNQINAISKSLESYINEEMNNSTAGFINLREDSDIDAYFERCNNGRIEKLENMTNIRFYTPDEVTGGRFSKEKAQEIYKKSTKMYGADEYRDIVIVADIDDETICSLPTVARYGDKWYLVNSGSMTSNILGLDSNHQSFFVLSALKEDLLLMFSPYSAAAVLPEIDISMKYESDGFDSPEETVVAYLNGLKNVDVQQMLQAFAWETQIENYSLKDYIRKMHSVNRYSPVRMPAYNDLIKGSNMLSLRYSETKSLYNAIRAFMVAETDKVEEINNYRIDLKSDEEIDEFIRLYNNNRYEKLKKMNNIRLISPSTVIQNYKNDSVSKRMKQYQEIYGADEILDILAVANIEDETLVCNPLLARYGDKWFVVSVGGIAFAIIGINSVYQAFLTIKGPFESLIQ